jgi:hypothetical protein
LVRRVKRCLSHILRHPQTHGMHALPVKLEEQSTAANVSVMVCGGLEAILPISRAEVIWLSGGIGKPGCKAPPHFLVPGTPAYTTHRAIQQESVHAILNGQHVTLWCQAGFRKCANLTPGTYTAEADGDKAVRIYVYSLISHKLMGKMKYRVVGSW